MPDMPSPFAPWQATPVPPPPLTSAPTSAPTEPTTEPPALAETAAAAAPTEVATAAAQAPIRQKHNPLHGVTLEAMVTALHAHYGWDELARLIPIRCFALDPSVASSLKFLRKTPWARDKVESLYLFMGREQRRGGQR